MGNSYSVVQEEQEEAEFRRLVDAVEIAQQRSTRQDDLESGLALRYPLLGPIGNGVPPVIPGALSHPPQIHPWIQPQAGPPAFAPASAIVPLEGEGPPVTIVSPPVPLKRRLRKKVIVVTNRSPASSWPASRESIRVWGEPNRLSSPFMPPSPHEEAGTGPTAAPRPCGLFAQRSTAYSMASASTASLSSSESLQDITHGVIDERGRSPSLKPLDNQNKSPTHSRHSAQSDRKLPPLDIRLDLVDETRSKQQHDLSSNDSRVYVEWPEAEALSARERRSPSLSPTRNPEGQHDRPSHDWYRPTGSSTGARSATTERREDLHDNHFLEQQLYKLRVERRPGRSPSVVSHHSWELPEDADAIVQQFEQMDSYEPEHGDRPGPESRSRSRTSRYSSRNRSRTPPRPPSHWSSPTFTHPALPQGLPVSSSAPIIRRLSPTQSREWSPAGATALIRQPPSTRRSSRLTRPRSYSRSPTRTHSPPTSHAPIIIQPPIGYAARPAGMAFGVPQVIPYPIGAHSRTPSRSVSPNREDRDGPHFARVTIQHSPTPSIRRSSRLTRRGSYSPSPTRTHSPPEQHIVRPRSHSHSRTPPPQQPTFVIGPGSVPGAPVVITRTASDRHDFSRAPSAIVIGRESSSDPHWHHRRTYSPPRYSRSPVRVYSRSCSRGHSHSRSPPLPSPPAPPQPTVVVVHPDLQHTSCTPPPIVIPPPPDHQPALPSPEQFEQLLQLHERSLATWEHQTRVWHEQSMRFAKVVQRLERHLVVSRHGGGMVSMDSIDSDVDEKDEKGMTAAQVQTLSYSAPMTKKPYPSRAYAAGLRAVRRCSDDWSPPWKVFPLKAFRGSNYMFLKIEAHWDDADLLRELSRSYDKLRTIWRKWFSLRSVRSITMVYADHTCVYPRRVGPAGVSPSKNMRLRYFLRHPDQMKGRHEFMQVLTARTDLGIEFVEGWQLMRISIAILLPVVASLILGVVYSILENDVSSAFTVAGYMTSAYSVCLVLLGLLNFVEF